MCCDLPAQHGKVFQSISTACEGGSVSTPEAGMQLVKVMLPCTREQDSQQEGVRAAQLS